MSAILFDCTWLGVRASSYGDIAGEGVGIVTLDNTPGRAMLDLFRRSDNVWMRRQFSADSGTYRFSGIPLGALYDLVGRDVTDTWDDVIVGRVSPFIPVSIEGSAVNVVAGDAYSYSYVISGGEGPFTFTLVGALPDGLELLTTPSGATISGVSTASEGVYSWNLQVEDARGTVDSIADSVLVVTKKTRWRLSISATNGNTNTTIWELKMRQHAGGSDLATGGTPFSNSEYNSGYQDDYAFDGNTSTRWAANGGAVGMPHIIGYQFASAVYINQLEMVADTGSGDAPQAFIVQSSNDGASWQDEWSVTGQVGWADHQTRIFNRP